MTPEKRGEFRDEALIRAMERQIDVLRSIGASEHALTIAERALALARGEE